MHWRQRTRDLELGRFLHGSAKEVVLRLTRLFAFQRNLESVADGREHEEYPPIVEVVVAHLLFELDDLHLVTLNAIAIDRCHFAPHDLIDVIYGCLYRFGNLHAVHVIMVTLGMVRRRCGRDAKFAVPSIILAAHVYLFVWDLPVDDHVDHAEVLDNFEAIWTVQIAHEVALVFPLVHLVANQRNIARGQYLHFVLVDHLILVVVVLK